MTAERPTSKREITERTADERLDFEPSADTSDIGDLTVPIELSEGTISTGEKVTVLGKADPVPEKAATDADAVVRYPPLKRWACQWTPSLATRRGGRKIAIPVHCP